MKLPIKLGYKLNGEDIVADLSKLPHLLIGGLSGYGKSNLIINLVDELAARKSPEEVKFLLIDPKMVEFTRIAERVSNYLYRPVSSISLDGAYTDINESYAAISALCAEMEHRYTLLQESRCRSIDEFNSKNETKLPYIVLVIDEYADLILLSSQFDAIWEDEDEEREANEVESVCDSDESSDDGDTFVTNIAKLGQFARVTGMHVILSTQRPSAAIVNGIIKASWPARIAFKVQNKRQSVIILDKSGAEKLESPGDFIWSYGGELTYAHAPLSVDYR